MKLIIAGGRDFNDYELCLNLMKKIKKKPTEIVSGGARGADTVGEWVAKELDIPIKRFLPDWDKYGKRAGFLRNTQMCEYADCALYFWDGESRGTKHCISEANRLRLKIKVVNY